MENIKYYALRLEFIIQLFRENQSDLLLNNQDKIKLLIEGYKKFVEHPHYNSLLPSSIETFILSS